MVRLAYLVMSLVPTAAVVALALYVVRAVSVRVVCAKRHPPSGRRAGGLSRGGPFEARAYTRPGERSLGHRRRP